MVRISQQRNLAWGAAVLAVATLASSCTQEPHSYQDPTAEDPVAVVVDQTRPQQIMLGGLYEGAMNNANIPALYHVEQMAENSDRLRLLSEHQADLIFGCTGELLASLNYKEAVRLSEEYIADQEAGEVDKNSGEWRDKVYETMVANLPEKATAGNPSSAVGCADVNDPPLPQNIVPVYRSSMFDRHEKLLLNQVSGTISTKDVEKLTEKAHGDLNLSVVVQDYLRANDL